MLVPSWRRTDWLAEWKSELWYVLQKCGRGQSLLFCLGAFTDAAWLRRNDCWPSPDEGLWLQSPSRCLSFLSAVAALAVALFLRSPGPLDTLLHAAQGHREHLLAHFLMIGIALLILPSTTSLQFGEYPTARVNFFRRWIFLGMKCGLLLLIVFCGAFDVAPIIGAAGLQPHATLAGYVLAFRWALIDQRRRCPVCLRLLSNPTSIGQPAHTFLEWYGTELICVRGHGLLHVPAIPASYCRCRWLNLDPSWNSLFS